MAVADQHPIQAEETRVNDQDACVLVDQWIFFQDAEPADLPFGKNATRDYIDEAGREDTAIWAVVDPAEICDRSKS